MIRNYYKNSFKSDYVTVIGCRSKVIYLLDHSIFIQKKKTHSKAQGA